MQANVNIIKMDTKICRSCMKQAEEWELANYDRGMIVMFSLCTNIQVAENDSLPMQFCYNCTIQIESSYQFIQTAQRVNSILLDFQRTSVQPEPINKDQISLETPLESHEDDENRAISCDGDVEPTDSSANDLKLNSNVKQVKSHNKKTAACPQFSCTVCKKTFQSKVWFEKHERNYHTKKYACSECSKTFVTQSRLSVHAVTHSDERKYVCECGKGYKRRKELTIHARTHADDRPFTCAHCNMSFKLKSVLKSHLVLHEPDKPYLCSVCGRRFAQAGNLSAHMRTHSGARPHACPCGYRAAAAAGLRRHQRRHRAPRAHRCRTCRRGFHERGALTRHERSHTGARPYQCPWCARAFADSWKRKCHAARAHGAPTT